MGFGFLLGLLVSFSASTACYAAQTIVTQKIDRAPVIDGRGDDAVWAQVQGVVTHDKVADIDITLKTVYTDKEIFWLVTFPDPDESREHKTLRWNKALEFYETGPEREDSFVFKWNMEPAPVDLSVDGDAPYTADIWFWKAHRTDPVGYADDKRHVLATDASPKSVKRISKRGKVFYLSRPGDEGTAPYKAIIYEEYQEDRLPKYKIAVPKGSRGDVKAKGVWNDGKWTVEFGRSLNTGHQNDIQLEPSGSYLFGVSRYEIGGREPDPATTQPLFGAGDVSEELTLIFGR